MYVVCPISQEVTEKSTRAPIAKRALIFDDILDNKEVKPKSNNVVETDNSAKDTVIRTRSGRVSKSTRSKDFVYY
jgi:hypothetical protein